MRFQSDTRPAHIPKLDALVEQKLKDIDPRFYLAFASFLRDPVTWERMRHPKTGKFAWRPRWYVLCDGNDGKQQMCFEIRDEEDGGFTAPTMENVVWRVFMDAGRHLTAAQIETMLSEQEQAQLESAKKRFEGLRQDTYQANASMIQDVMDDHESLMGHVGENKRDAKIFSYEGQENRGTHNDAIPVKPTDLGWEKPDFVKEME